MDPTGRLEARVRREVRGLRGKMSVYLARRGGDVVGVGADAPGPLASLYKVPVLVELFRRVDRGSIRLGSRWTVRDELQSPGSDALEHLAAGLRPTVHDLAMLMIIHSDNTAADILFKRLGLGSVNPTMQRLGCASLDVYMPSREWYLLVLGLAPHFHGLSPAEVARRWRAMGPSVRSAEVAWLMDRGGRVSLRRMRSRERELLLSGVARSPGMRALEQATDNVGSARDVGLLFARIAEGRAASGASCRRILGILRAQLHHRLALGLPAGADFATKTGTIQGVVNDAGLLFPPRRPPIVAACLARDLTPSQMTEAPRAIARIAKAAWAAWS